MNYSKWSTREELLSVLKKINHNSEITKSGVPMAYDEDSLYVKDDLTQTLVIGCTGSGKTQVTELPELKLAILAGESIAVNDLKGEIYEILKDDLDKAGYNTVVINLANPEKGNSFNPLALPYKLYKEGNKDTALELLEKIAHYFFANENVNSNIDPFWENSAMSLFVGLTLYLFETKEESEINLNNVANLVTDLDTVTEYVKNLNTTSQIYSNLSITLLAPTETKGSIISVFNQSIRLFTSRIALSELMSKTDFDILNVQKEKTAVFVISEGKTGLRRLLSIIFDQLYQASIINNAKERRFNIFLDDFNELFPIKDFVNNLNMARSYGICFYIYIKSFLDLNNNYGKETTEMLKISFGNIIYLLSNDIETLEEVSKMCGRTKVNNEFAPLITPEELKLLQTFEAIILIPRMSPIRTKLTPYYKMNI